MIDKLNFNNIKEFNTEDIKLIYDNTGLEVPTNLHSFLKLYSGGDSNNHNYIYTYDIIHEDGWKTSNSILLVLTAEKIIEYFTNLKPYLQDTMEHFELDTNFVETDFLLPIIELGDGGTINIAIGGDHNGKIYEVDNGDFGIILQSNSLEEFINSLYIYDQNKDEFIKS